MTPLLWGVIIGWLLAILGIVVGDALNRRLGQ